LSFVEKICGTSFKLIGVDIDALQCTQISDH
jgi:hypothetical protein